MAVVHHVHERTNTHDGGGTGLIMGVILLLVVAFLLFYYGIPALNRVGTSTPQINVPEKVDVNVNQGQGN